MKWDSILIEINLILAQNFLNVLHVTLLMTI